MSVKKKRVAFDRLPSFQQALVEQAWEASRNSYSPYSKFPVGAAIIARNPRGERQTFTGCNVENASYGGTICAERTAAVKAVSAGFREFQYVAVVCAKHPGGSPCGLCRQVLREFGPRSVILNIMDTDNSVEAWTMEELLPDSFGPESLGGTAPDRGTSR